MGGGGTARSYFEAGANFKQRMSVNFGGVGVRYDMMLNDHQFVYPFASLNVGWIGYRDSVTPVEPSPGNLPDPEHKDRKEFRGTKGVIYISGGMFLSLTDFSELKVKESLDSPFAQSKNVKLGLTAAITQVIDRRGDYYDFTDLIFSGGIDLRF